MKNFFILSFCLYLLVSCSENPKKFITLDSDTDKKELISSDSLVYLKDYKFPEEHIRFFKNDNWGSQVEAFRLISPLRSINKIVYIVDGDIQIPISKIDSLAQLTELEISTENVAAMSAVRNDQYSTIELVATPKNIRICGINVANETLKTAVQNAIENYNDLDLQLTFEFVEWFTVKTGIDKDTFDEWRNEENIDIIITEVSGNGGLAGFPKNGLPFDYITIGKKIAPTFGLNVTTHVVTHEIGHCIGLRHTDFFNRELSCGVERDNNGNIIDPDEGRASIGAIHVPGTPPDYDLDMESVMLACYNPNQTGDFSDDDEIALTHMYEN